jgi:hypothetical protein
MPAPRRRITHDEAPEPLTNQRTAQQPPPEWGAANRVDGRALRRGADRLPRPAAIRIVELVRPGRATPEPFGSPSSAG